MRGAPNVTPIPDDIRETLMDWHKHNWGALSKLARRMGAHSTSLHRVGRGEQKAMDAGFIKRIQKALPGFDPGERSMPKRRRGKNIVKPPKANGVATVAQLMEARQQAYPWNGQEAGLRGLIDGMAIQAEITSRAVREFLDQPHAVPAS